ncbi:DUF2312 domain-containing protein [Tardibacter chloracetimidivorans]
MSGGNNPASPGSIQLRAYLAARRSGQSTEAAASIAGFNAEEARLTDAAEARGELEHIDTSAPTAGHNSGEMPMNVAADQLRQYVERAERLIEERKGLNDDLKDVFAEAKSQGFDVPTIKWVIRERAVERQKREEQNALRETYAVQLGLAF